MMKILVIGQGGREHALVRQLSKSCPGSIYVWPGSSGMNDDAIVLGVTSEVSSATKVQSSGSTHTDVPAIVHAMIQRHQIDLVVIGPEQPLADGLSDALRAKGVRVFAPSKEGAKLESSKIHAKEIMRSAGVQTARSFTVSSVEETLKSAREFQPPYVLKADGLAAGKGVFIEKTLEGLERSARLIFEDRILGEAGRRALLEEFSPGYEVSHLVFTNGRMFCSMPPARDHKRLLEGDQGPNTGGMGVVAPVAMEPGLLQTIEEKVVTPVIREIEKRGILFRGILYFGLMITKDGPSVLEFNTRFGDPEAQVLLPLLDEVEGSALPEILSAIADGEMPEIRWAKGRAAACVVLAAEGYPDRPTKGTTLNLKTLDIAKLKLQPGEDAYRLHAGTESIDGTFVTNGGRVLNAIGVAGSLDRALGLAYGVADQSRWPGSQMRRDIGRTL